MKCLIILVVFAISVYKCGESVPIQYGDSRMIQLFKKDGIIPDVLPQYNSNMGIVLVKFPTGVQALGGNYINNALLLAAPNYFYWNANPNTYYTLVITGPDFPSRTNRILGEFRVLLVVNILGNDVSLGEVYSAYVLPTVTPGTGAHRTVVLVYQQPGKILNFNGITKVVTQTVSNVPYATRIKWSVSQFAQQNNLGFPVFGNYYFVVPILLQGDLTQVLG